jgi:ATP-dependent Clp protease ATP-binding subunit ClpA
LETRLAVRKVSLVVTDAARTWLAEGGYDDKLGARPLGRLIQREIENKLSDEILFGALEKGGVVRVDVNDSALDFTFEEKVSAQA